MSKNPECGARKRQRPEGHDADCTCKDCRCRNTAGFKTDHVGAGTCHLHGGNTPDSSEHGKAVLVDRKSMEILSRQGVIPVENPFDELAKFAAEVVAHKDFLARGVAELEDLTYEDKLGRQDIAPMLAEYRESLDQTRRILVEMSKIDLDKKRIRISAIQAGHFIMVLEKTIAKAGLDDATTKALMQYAGTELAKVSQALQTDTPPA